MLAQTEPISPSLPYGSLPGKRENRENLFSERRRGGGDVTDGERGGVTAERGGGGERERRSRLFVTRNVTVGVSD